MGIWVDGLLSFSHDRRCLTSVNVDIFTRLDIHAHSLQKHIRSINN